MTFQKMAAEETSAGDSQRSRSSLLVDYLLDSKTLIQTTVLFYKSKSFFFSLQVQATLDLHRRC